ncbi:hypothetical protein BDV28DRAFT_112885 [Aspergillus coremiiformis]|uniref:Uncharacterized protein n=1 Tax=Aspergillus coremiiformis TaxID=138285 RepID=A0A5N6Z8K2_9EURO|nr:hypothetical protein BDV28DRAFT_112885 [Aspergillus coremiiformis]
MFSTILTGLLALSSSATARSVDIRSLAARSITPPEGCPIPTWTVDNFRWFNGSHSLDCIHNDVDRNTKGCLCEQGWCNPNTCNSTLVNVCYTGMPNYQPWGYGPPQTLAIDFQDGLKCADTYIGYRIHDIGHGESNCGYADRSLGRIVSFYGSSNEATSTGHIDYVLGSGHALECANGSKITYSGSTDFTLNCVHDASFNATCTAAPFEVPVLSYSWVN